MPEEKAKLAYTAFNEYLELKRKGHHFAPPYEILAAEEQGAWEKVVVVLAQNKE